MDVVIDAACSEENCSKRLRARGLCSTHYNRLWKSGELPNTPSKTPNPHTLANVDMVRARADCAQCGPGIPVRVRIGKHRKDSKIKVVCRARIHGRRRQERYGLSIEEYAALGERQGGRCAICEARIDNLHVDHCHSTGRVRGLLCGPCNRGIGMLRDDPAILRRAIDYLS